MWESGYIESSFIDVGKLDTESKPVVGSVYIYITPQAHLSSWGLLILDTKWCLFVKPLAGWDIPSATLGLYLHRAKSIEK